ncbi:MAG: hypothetical protein ABIL01_35240 [Pseudomonadota bacterium]
MIQELSHLEKQLPFLLGALRTHLYRQIVIAADLNLPRTLVVFTLRAVFQRKT